MIMLVLCLAVVVLSPLLVASRQQEVSFNEETPIGTIIFDLNTLSSSLITYQLLESSPLLVFNATSNLIAIGKRIDRDSLCPNDETCSKCQLTMKFYDMFFYDILILTFNINDINDNAPVFNSNTYSISLTENNIPGIKLRLSKAEDIDCASNGVQLYELTYVFNGRVHISSINLHHRPNRTAPAGEPHRFYLVDDRKNSELYLIVNQTLDREEQNEFIFTITANDYSHTSSAKLLLTVLDVNDHLARFTQSIYSINISQSTPPGTLLTKLSAFDADLDQNARIYYSLLTIDGSNQQQDLFQINSHTGELRLLANLTQIESKPIFKLVVGASDGTTNAIPALTTVYVNIIQQSVITVTFGSNRISSNASDVFLYENLPNATFIAYVTADEPIQVLPNVADRGFFVQKLSDNSFTLLTDRSYDRETRSSYDVFVRSRDDERSFRIIVNDVNDCKPTWDTTMLNIDLESSQRRFSLNASDADEGMNGKVGYRKVNDASWPRWIDLVDNQLVLNCTNATDDRCWLDASQADLFIEVDAFDYGQPELSSRIQLHLYRRSSQAMFIKTEYIFLGVASLLGVLFVVVAIVLGICCRRKHQRAKASADDNFTKQKIIPTPPSTSSEHTSSAGSLYGSDKSDNITLETAASCHLDMYLFSPKRASTVPDSPYPGSFLAKAPSPSENLTNKLFHSIQTDLSLLTDSTANRGTYV